MRNMEGSVQIVREDDFPNWNSHRIQLEVLKLIGLNEPVHPANEFATIIVETGSRYRIPLEAHVTMSAIDINGRSIFVNTF